MRLYFVRHGQTKLNQEKVYFGSLDEPLNEYGRKQATDVGLALAEVSFDSVYCSDRMRAIETMQQILAQTKQKGHVKVMSFLPELSEIHFGCFEGLTWQEASRQYPDVYEKWCQDWLYYELPEGESYAAFFQRVRHAFEQILEGSKDVDQNVLICAHNGSLRALFALLCGIEESGSWHFNFDSGTYSRVDYECGNFTIRKINCRDRECA